ncbi:CinA family protein [Erythrobacter citreus]|jgi:PncC family amidohydrolase|uniref:CinA family protein n=1 Tax=Qipengyuania citrea TaxID=225971 RepID=A0A6I4UCW7_9SPHN|nr:CinA family protein [Qipengyuania citrea]MDQ0565370.1 PncC family amidohydrolase [Qipengyuania citrea]MXP35617.1 CinA family protein [Qipengyuania citrea]|tara:strand:+ start:112 stop:603 length:492 start_codon:yes stop_codon:yes gene_type:complete
MLEQTHKQALRIADLLRQRGEKIAVADGATGGLVAASLLTVPGALDFFVGGGVVYSFRARDILFDLPRDAYAGMRGASEEYALLQARAIRDNFGAEWGLAESGSVGGSSHPSGAPAGRSCAAVVGPGGFEFIRRTETGSDDRIANMEAFARAALETLEEALQR